MRDQGYNIESNDRQELRRQLAVYQRPGRWKSVWQLSTNLIAYGLLWYVAYLALAYSIWLALPVIALLTGFLVRLFIIFHDCGHGSFFKSRRANNCWGIVTGIVVFTPYYHWRDAHARHHATSGNLDRRGEGDIWLMTLREYLQAPRWERFKYRLYRNPAVMFLLGPVLLTLVTNRFPGRAPSRSDRWSVYSTNAVLAVVSTIMILLVGWKAFLLIQLLALFLSHIAGVWLFYVQHQFEGVYWKRDSEWDFVTASLLGGSFYKLPGIMRWFSGSIGYHHVHHLNARIPNYNLARCQKNVQALQEAKSIGIFASLRSLTFRLWDEDKGRLISFKEARRNPAPAVD
jgi:omega-6 fatty acid desaturase (delta-12 desaturase)